MEKMGYKYDRPRSRCRKIARIRELPPDSLTITEINVVEMLEAALASQTGRIVIEIPASGMPGSPATLDVEIWQHKLAKENTKWPRCPKSDTMPGGWLSFLGFQPRNYPRYGWRGRLGWRLGGDHGVWGADCFSRFV